MATRGQRQADGPAPEPATIPSAPPQALESGRAFKAPMRALGAWLRRSPLFRTRRRAILTALFCIPLLLCLGYWLLGAVAFGDAAHLVELKGMVQSRKEQDGRWQPAQLNQLLWRSDRVRTGDGSGARLLFFDVSTVDLEENTEISVMRCAKRRGGRAVDVVLKTWIGKTAVRAVRFVDPSSSFRVDTPTASTVVRGARFTVEVSEEGTTQIDLEEGVAKIQLLDQQEAITLEMGERITLEPSGVYVVERIFEPDPQPMYDKVGAAWSALDDQLRLRLTETEVNLFLAAMSDQQPDFFLRDTQVWFVDGEARIATTVVKPRNLDLSAAFGVEVVDGKLVPDMRSIAAGVALPVPDPILDVAVETVLGQMEDYLRQAYDYLEFDAVRIGDGYLLVVGRKQLDTPVDP